jgi:Hydrogenase maturation factor
MDLEDYIRTTNKEITKDEVIENITKTLMLYKKLTEDKAKLLASTIYNEVITSINAEKSFELLNTPKTGYRVGEMGVGSRGSGDHLVHSLLLKLIGKSEKDFEDAGFVKIKDNIIIACSIDGIHSRLSYFPLIAGFQVAKASLRDIMVKGAKPIGLAIDLRMADDGDIGYLLDFETGVSTVAELMNIQIIAGSTLRIGGDMVIGSRLTGSVLAIGFLESEPFYRNRVKEGDVIIMTEGSGGGTIAATSIYNNYFDVVIETLNIKTLKALSILISSKVAKRINSMSDITNGGIVGEAREISDTAGVSFLIHDEKVKSLINRKVLNMLNELNIDYYGISLDSILIFSKEQEADEIISKLRENNIRADIIGEVTKKIRVR